MGSEATEFTVPYALIFSKAKWLNDMHADGEKTIELRQFESDVFDAYLHWVYASEIETKAMANESEACPYETPMLLSLTKLWILADHLEDAQLCNKLTDMLSDGMYQRTVPSSPIPWNTNDIVAAVDYAFERNGGCSKLRILFEDTLLVGLNTKTGKASNFFHGALRQLSKDVLAEFSGRWFSGQGVPDMGKVKTLRGLQKAKYHKDGGVEAGVPMQATQRRSSRADSLQRLRSVSRSPRSSEPSPFY